MNGNNTSDRDHALPIGAIGYSLIGVHASAALSNHLCSARQHLAVHVVVTVADRQTCAVG